ncbi:hypothetical protein B0H12DRAFT_1246623 [Mycena haematopus]|nr:hypothetical protein B0H12DRAFT_1246623 [Mycena haematopus]
MNSDHLSPNSRNCVLDATDALRRRIDLLPVGAVAYGAHNRADGFDNRLRIINTPVDAVPDVAAARRRRIDLLPVGAVIDGTRVEGATNHLPNDEAEVDLSFLPDTFVTRECYDLHRGDVVHRDISMAELVPEYIASRPSGVDDEPDLDFQALHSRYYTRSAARLWANRLASSSLEHEDPPTVSTRKRTAAVSFPELPKPKRKRHKLLSQIEFQIQSGWMRIESCVNIADAAACINSGPNKDLINTGAQVTEGFAAYQKNDRPDTEDGVPSLTNDLIRSTAHSHAKPSAGCKTRRGNRRPDHKIKKTLDNYKALSLLGPFVLRLLSSFIDKKMVLPFTTTSLIFFLYLTVVSIDLERATFFVDRDGHTFMYRSYRALWLMARAHEVEHAHNVLVGSDLQKATERAKYHKAVRGPHMALIFGHHKQSAVKPYLTKWHTLNQDRVDEFMNLKIVKDIIGFVTDIVTTVFPGVAARFKTDADWHFEHYGIRPLFGLFWNLCLNAWFPGQRRIQCAPHADFKNQIGVCVLLIYVLECGVGFNDTQRTWIVIWEADVIVQLPPWTIAIYPSALFFHFNIDVHQIQFVTTEGNILPTRENVRPVEEGDDIGRGSFVFFNQSTMRHGPETGFDTLKMAAASGHSVTGDYGSSAQEAFSKHGVFCPLPRAP